MMSQVKRKQKLLLALTLTVLITGSILAFSIQEAYSAKNFNSSKSNTSTAISQVRADLQDLKENFEVYLEGNNVESYIDNTLVWLDKAEMGVGEMAELYLVLSIFVEESTKKATEPIPQDPSMAPGVAEPIPQDPSMAPGDPIEDIDINIEQIPGGGISITLKETDLMAPGDPINDIDINIEQIPGGNVLLTLTPGTFDLESDSTPAIIPDWTKKNAGWWADGLISDDDYVIGLEWMIKNGIIRI